MEGQINKRFITLEEAAAIVAAGGDVDALRECGDGWEMMHVTTFRRWMEGMLFVADVLNEIPAEEPAKQEKKQDPEKKSEAEAKKPRKGGRRARDWDEERILEMYASGATLEAIAKEMNCTTAPIRKIVAKVYADANGKLPRGSQRQIKQEIDTGKIGALYAAGWGVKEITEEMHIDAVEGSKIIEKMEREAMAKNEVSEG